MTATSPFPLADKADVIRGVTFSKGDAVSLPRDGYTPVLRAGNIQGHLILDDDLVYVPERMVSEKQRLRRGDIVMATSSGSAAIVGKTAFADQDWIGSFGAFCAVIRPKLGKCNPRYLFHYLQTPQFREWTRNSSGVGIKNIRKSELDSYVVSFPDLDEQCRIAAVLDKADAIRRKRELAFTLADDFLRSVFLEMFGDPLTNPKGFKREKVALHLSKDRPGVQSGPFGAALKKHEYTTAGIPVWGVENVQANRFVDKARLFITEEKYQALDRYRVVNGDVLISRAGTVGRMCIAETAIQDSIISTNLTRVSLNPKTLTPEFFVSLFTYVPERLGALKANNKDEAFTFLHPSTLKVTEIPIPDMAVQQRFVQIVERHKGNKSFQEHDLRQATDLLAALSQRAFAGNL